MTGVQTCALPICFPVTILKNNSIKVLIPGDKEKREYVIREKNGIPMDSFKFNEFLNISEDFNNAVI